MKEKVVKVIDGVTVEEYVDRGAGGGREHRFEVARANRKLRDETEAMPPRLIGGGDGEES